MNTIVDSVHIVSLIVYICALTATTIFYLKLRHEKYWIGFPVTFLFLLLHEVFEILHDAYAMGYTIEVLAELSEIIGAFVLTFSMYFLIKEISKINRLEEEPDITDED